MSEGGASDGDVDTALAALLVEKDEGAIDQNPRAQTQIFAPKCATHKDYHTSNGKLSV